MKNIQIVDGAKNCTYSLYAATDREFATLFPEGTDVAFPDEVWHRLGKHVATRVFDALWSRPIDKKKATGIHGTLFYQLDYKKDLYPTRCERDMNERSYSEAQRKVLRLGRRASK